MKTGDIILLPFPFAEITNVKVRPAVVIGLTKDIYTDIIVSAISSVIPNKISSAEMLLTADKINNLRTNSVIKIDRIATLKKDSIIIKLGKLKKNDLDQFIKLFKTLPD